MKRLHILLVAIGLLLVLAACGGTTAVEPTTQPPAEPSMDDTAHDDTDDMADMADDSPSDDTMMDDDDAMMDDDAMDENMMDDDSDAMMDDSHSDDAMMDDDDAMMEDDSAMTDDTPAAALPAWQTLPLTDARTGEQYTFADFSGKTVFVEPMATWCSNCRRQLGDVNAARSAFSADEVVFIGLSVETVIADSELATYADDNGWDWTFSVLSEEALQALVAEFGQSVANPPATPHFIIRPDGSVTALETGIESADEITAQIQAAMQ